MNFEMKKGFYPQMTEDESDAVVKVIAIGLMGGGVWSIAVALLIYLLGWA